MRLACVAAIEMRVEIADNAGFSDADVEKLGFMEHKDQSDLSLSSSI